jgi:hypothetical protein
MLPNFLGIGAPRAGTTWLHELLRTHPEVWVPSLRKEIHYFDVHFDRPQSWYESFFPTNDRDRFKAFGEITPHYLYSEEAPERIKSVGTVTGFLLMLRNPVDRAFSHYKWRIRLDAYRGDFTDFLEDYPSAIEWSMYGRHVERYLNHFPRDTILAIPFESGTRDYHNTRKQLASFLGVAPDLFPAGAGRRPANASRVPPRALAGVTKRALSLGRALRRADLDVIPNVAGRIGMKRLLAAKGREPVLSPRARAEVMDRFAPDIAQLESLLDLDLASGWATADGP